MLPPWALGEGPIPRQCPPTWDPATGVTTLRSHCCPAGLHSVKSAPVRTPLMITETLTLCHGGISSDAVQGGQSGLWGWMNNSEKAGGFHAFPRKGYNVPAFIEPGEAAGTHRHFHTYHSDIAVREVPLSSPPHSEGRETHRFTSHSKGIEPAVTDHKATLTMPAPGVPLRPGETKGHRPKRAD